MRKRKVKKIGNSYFIALAKVDVDDFGLVIGDEVDIDDLNLIGGEDQSERVCCDIDKILNNKENKK